MGSARFRLGRKSGVSLKSVVTANTWREGKDLKTSKFREGERRLCLELVVMSNTKRGGKKRVAECDFGLPGHLSV